MMLRNIMMWGPKTIAKSWKSDGSYCLVNWRFGTYRGLRFSCNFSEGVGNISTNLSEHLERFHPENLFVQLLYLWCWFEIVISFHSVMLQLSDHVGLLDGSPKGQTHFHRTSGASGKLATGQRSTGYSCVYWKQGFSVTTKACLRVRVCMARHLSEYFSLRRMVKIIFHWQWGIWMGDQESLSLERHHMPQEQKA